MRFYLDEHEFVFEADAQYPAARPTTMQQIMDRTAASTIQVETYAVPIRNRTLTFSLMSKVDYDGLLNWFVNIVNGIEKKFGFEDERGDHFVVRFTNTSFNLKEVSYHRFSGSLDLEIG